MVISWEDGTQYSKRYLAANPFNNKLDNIACKKVISWRLPESWHVQVASSTNHALSFAVQYYNANRLTVFDRRIAEIGLAYFARDMHIW